MKRRPDPDQLVALFNAAVRVGDEVEYSEVIGVTEPTRHRTRTQAEVLSGHSPVVWLEGKTGCVMVTHCKPLEARATT